MKKLHMKKHATDGFLITFCGLDGCGKTTMLQKLANDLSRENDVFLTKQPTSAVRESAIFRTYMDTPNHSQYDYRSLSLLAASDRVQHSNKEILPQLEQGKIVISDRYIYSCLANLRARGFTQDKWIYEISASLPRPDIAFFFDAPVPTCLTRVRARPEEANRYVDIDLQYKLRDEYLRICKRNNGILISTTLAVEESYRQVLNKVKEVLGVK